MDKELFTIPEAAAWLGITTADVEAAIQARELRAYKRPTSRPILIYKRDLMAYRLKVQPSTTVAVEGQAHT